VAYPTAPAPADQPAEVTAVQNSKIQDHLITVDGASHEITEAVLRELIDSSTRFWLDLAGLDHDTAQTLLRDTFGFHPLAVEDAEHFGQRPKWDGHEGFALMVVYGATAAGSLVEVHCFYTENYLVTVHHDDCPDLTNLGERLRRRVGPAPDHVMLLYLVVDTLVDGYIPVLANLDDQIDQLEDEILERPTEQQLGQLYDLKRSLIAIRKVVTPQRDMFATLLSGRDALPGMTPDAGRYFRDLYDHLIRIRDPVDSYRDLVTGALDTHLSTVSSRLNVVMKQLAMIATIFLPLTFLTAFFGHNFGWMVNRLTSFTVFLLVGIGLQILVVVALVPLFRQRGWLTSNGTVPPPTPARRRRVSLDKRWHVIHIGSDHEPKLAPPLPVHTVLSADG
jgi:magnesium transporter